MFYFNSCNAVALTGISCSDPNSLVNSSASLLSHKEWKRRDISLTWKDRRIFHHKKTGSSAKSPRAGHLPYTRCFHHQKRENSQTSEKILMLFRYIDPFKTHYLITHSIPITIHEIGSILGPILQGKTETPKE